jgi:hypothetical protein
VLCLTCPSCAASITCAYDITHGLNTAKGNRRQAGRAELCRVRVRSHSWLRPHLRQLFGHTGNVPADIDIPGAGLFGDALTTLEQTHSGGPRARSSSSAAQAIRRGSCGLRGPPGHAGRGVARRRLRRRGVLKASLPSGMPAVLPSLFFPSPAAFQGAAAFADSLQQQLKRTEALACSTWSGSNCTSRRSTWRFQVLMEGSVQLQPTDVFDTVTLEMPGLPRETALCWDPQRGPLAAYRQLFETIGLLPNKDGRFLVSSGISSSGSVSVADGKEGQGGGCSPRLRASCGESETRCRRW